MCQTVMLFPYTFNLDHPCSHPARDLPWNGSGMLGAFFIEVYCCCSLTKFLIKPLSSAWLRLSDVSFMSH